MALRAALVLVSIAVLGCQPDARSSGEDAGSGGSPREAEGPSAPPVGAWVVLEAKATLQLEPNREGASLQLRGELPVVMRVVAVHGEFFEVETIPDVSSRGCAYGVGVEDRFTLRWFVSESELGTVLAKPKRVEFDDGTSLELAAGVPVDPSTSDAVLVGASSVHVRLDDYRETARWYAEPELLPVDAPGSLRLRPRTSLRFGEHSTTASLPHFALAQASEPIDGGELLTFVGPCGRFRLRAEAGAIDTSTPDAEEEAREEFGIVHSDPDAPEIARRPSGKIFGMQADYDPFAPTGVCERGRWSIAAGTPVHWATARREAGVVLRPQLLPPDAVEQEGWVCFAVDEFELCADATALERVDDPLCADLGLVGALGTVNRQRSAQVLHGKPEVRGDGLDRDTLRRMLSAYGSQLESCYQAGLARAPTLGGRLTLTWVIGPRGKVARVKVKSTELKPADAAVEACFSKVVQRGLFPKPRDGSSVEVEFPFVLVPPARGEQ